MSEVLTIREIEEKFDSEWVLIGDLQTNEKYEVLGGRVLFHGKDREEVFEKVEEFDPKRFTVRWIGKDDAETVFIL